MHVASCPTAARLPDNPPLNGIPFTATPSSAHPTLPAGFPRSAICRYRFIQIWVTPESPSSSMAGQAAFRL
jgi:hypothetical protein